MCFFSWHCPKTSNYWSVSFNYWKYCRVNCLHQISRYADKQRGLFDHLSYTICQRKNLWSNCNLIRNLMATVQNIHNRRVFGGEEECLNNRTFFRSPRDPLSPFSLVCWMQAHLWLQLPYSPEHSFFFQFSCSFSSLWNWACSKSSCKSNVGNLERQSASNHNHLQRSHTSNVRMFYSDVKLVAGE